MPRKQFIADLERTKQSCSVGGIRGLCNGDDDGQFKFMFNDPAHPQAIWITASVLDLADYPQKHQCMVFAADDVPQATASALPDPSRLKGKTVEELLRVVAGALSGDDDMESDDEEEEDLEYDWEVDEEPSNFNLPISHHEPVSDRSTPSTAERRNRIRADLILTRKAGFKIGQSGRLLENGACIVSVSIRIGKLGISKAAMQAWQVDPSDYVILLLHYPYYKTLDELLPCRANGYRGSPRICIRVSNRYKPTPEQAVAAFQPDRVNDHDAMTTEKNKICEMFISRPLESFLNERLVPILSFRAGGMSRSGAESFYIEQSATGLHSMDDKILTKYRVEEDGENAYPPIVNADHATDSGSSVRSLPLLAMQMLLRHFVRCTEFCLVCHRKLDTKLGAIKPYVCSNQLCLFQYIGLGFGPSLEHEILAQPWTVDLLISFAYASAFGGRLTEFPQGLDLNIPKSRALATPIICGHLPRHEFSTVKGMEVKFDMTSRNLVFQDAAVRPSQHFNQGDWIVIHTTAVCAYHCRIESVTLFPCVSLGPLVCLLNGKAQYADHMNAPGLASHSAFGWQDATLELYDEKFDNLTQAVKRAAIVDMLELLPSVKEMKEYLSRPGQKADLTRWVERIPPATLALLRWIVASNRACIMQVDDVDAVTGNHVAREERVFGMSGFMQFRFAMGAPDKEERFVQAVQKASARVKPPVNTIFAWHGSGLANWHSIIREGLHYNEVAHGRSFGNGVYHATSAHVSLGYSGYPDHRPSGLNEEGWTKSVLGVSTVLALNELVNVPAEFRSCYPYYVVDNLDWIQTRYLFVKCNKTWASSSALEKEPVERLQQDPNRTPFGHLCIPIIIPAAIGRTAKGKRKRSMTALDQHASHKRSKSIPEGRPEKENSRFTTVSDNNASDGMSDATDNEILEILQLEPMGTIGQPGARTSMNQSQPEMGAFVPGSLDHSSLPRLPEPEYANRTATNRLQKDFRHLLKVQETHPLHELGWYIDPERVENMYQWIIELHTFEAFADGGKHIPLVADLQEAGVKSVVLELRFPGSYPMSPPFVRVIKPRFLSFAAGGGGHVTAGGAICMELLTNSGWNVASTIDAVLLQVRMAIASTDPRPARLEKNGRSSVDTQYGVREAVDAYKRACIAHGWVIPKDFDSMMAGVRH